jgi:MYXO-CTERM domain-containing protein
MRSTAPWLALSSLAAAGAVFLSPGTAQAGIEACGNIEVRAEAQCTVEVEGGCTAKCEPVRFEASCAAKLEAQCSGQCTAEASVDCQGSCTGSCQGQCEADPGSLDCSANCKGTCEADCSGSCASSGNKSECEASCRANCSGSCDAQCSGTPPSASCEAKCEASCSGSCKGRANIDCQVECQSSGYVDCKASLEGGCQARCSSPEGALFCDGQYVDTGNNLQNCIAALNAYLKVKVDASASAACEGNQCSAEADASVSCGVTPAGDSGSGGLWILGVLSAVGLAASRRRSPRA